MLPKFRVHWEQFCRSQDIVVGAPGVTFFHGEHWVLDGSLAVAQQIEQRVWVGLRYAGREAVKGHGCVNIATNPDAHRIWLPGFDRPKAFKDFRAPVGSCEWKDKTQGLEWFINGLILRPACRDFLALDGAPVELSILSEVRSGSGCDFSGAFSVATVVALHLAAVWLGKTKPLIGGDLLVESMSKTCCLFSKDIQRPLLAAESVIDRINRAALVLETNFHGGRASGYGTLCSLMPTKWPMVYIRETPSLGRIPETIEGGWDEFDRRPPSEEEWAMIDRCLLDPQTGLHYAVGWFEDDKRLVPDPDANHPFAFGTVYSGNPKDTKSMITQVRALQKDIRDNLRSDLSFFITDELLTRGFVGKSRPLFFEHLEQLGSEDPSISVRAVDAGGSWAAMLTVHALCKLFRVVREGNPGNKDMDNALAFLAAAIRAAQGGLSQLLLVDADACRIIGCILNTFEVCKEQIGVKYTGGARGGHLLCMGPTTLNPALLGDCLRSMVPVDDGRPEWDKPRVDYWSEDDPPRGEGIKFCQRAARKDPGRGWLRRYAPSKKKWVKTSEKEVGEWHVELLIQEDLVERCVVELDMRGDQENALSRLFTGKNELALNAENRRGVNALAHMLRILLEKGGSASNNDLLKYAERMQVKMKSYIEYMKNARSLITGRVGGVAERPRWFNLLCTDVRSPKEYQIELQVPNDGSGEIYLYLQR